MTNIKESIVLDLGCGNRKKKFRDTRVVGIDRIKLEGVDVVHDLEKFPYPFENNYFDEIIADDVIEHLEDVIKTLEELWRIGKPGAIIKISTPHFSSDNYFTDPSHKHPFSSRSFDFFDERYASSVHQFYSTARFEVLKKIISFSEVLPSGRKHHLNIHKIIGIEKLVNRFPRLYEKFFAFIIPATELYFELKIIKNEKK